MRLVTPRLVIRSLRPADVEPLVAMWTDPEVMLHLGGPREAEKVRAALRAKLAVADSAGAVDKFDLWPVALAAQPDGPTIGDCGLVAKEIDGVGEIELVYLFARQAWGRGYATEAAAALRDHAFTTLSLSRLVALIEPGHVASACVAEKIGMHRERQTVRSGGRVMDLYLIEN